MGCGCANPEKRAEVRRRTTRRAADTQVLPMRLAWCATASECGRLCPRLVKGPGVSQVFCVDIETGERIDLYAALAQREFRCPRGMF